MTFKTAAMSAMLVAAALVSARSVRAESLSDLFDAVKKGADTAEAVDKLRSNKGGPSVEPLTKREVVELVAEEVPASVIVAAIQKRKCAFQVEASELVELKKRGVDEAVLKAMVENSVSVRLARDVQFAKISFVPPAHGQWSLRSKDGELVCTLPCESKVNSAAGMYVQKEDAPTRIFVPKTFENGSDSQFEMEVVDRKGSPEAAIYTGLGGTILGVFGAGAWGYGWSLESRGKGEGFRTAGQVMVGTGVAVLVTGIILGLNSRFGTMVERPAAPKPKSSPPPSNSSASVVFGPGALFGTF